MKPLEKIVRSLEGETIELTDDENSVVIMACHLHAVAIADMKSKSERTAAVDRLPPGISDAIKAEIIQIFNSRKSDERPDER